MKPKPERQGLPIPPRGPVDVNALERTCLIVIIVLYKYFMRKFGEIVQILHKSMLHIKWHEKMTSANNILKMLLSGQTSMSSQCHNVMMSIFVRGPVTSINKNSVLTAHAHKNHLINIRFSLC